MGLVSLAALTTAFPAPAGPTPTPRRWSARVVPSWHLSTDVLLKADSGLAPLNPQYTDANLDNAVGDFVGTAPGTFGADFAVSERPLTATEAATAKANGRTFAYVPFAATPVAIATLAVCNSSNLIGNTTAALCPNIPLTPALVAACSLPQPHQFGSVSQSGPPCPPSRAGRIRVCPRRAASRFPMLDLPSIDPRAIGREHSTNGAIGQRPDRQGTARQRFEQPGECRDDNE